MNEEHISIYKKNNNKINIMNTSNDGKKRVKTNWTERIDFKESPKKQNYIFLNSLEWNKKIKKNFFIITVYYLYNSLKVNFKNIR